VLQVIINKGAAFAVSQPFFTRLVSAPVELPHILPYVAKVLACVNPHPVIFRRVNSLFNEVVALHRKLSDEVIQLGSLHQMNRNKFLPLITYGSKQLLV
jgi:hypothetical protein